MIPTLTARRGSTILPGSLPVGRSTDTVRIARQPLGVTIPIIIQGKVVSNLSLKIATGTSTPSNVPLEIGISPKARLKAEWSSRVAEAIAMRKITPNPVDDLVNLFGSLPGDYA